MLLCLQYFLFRPTSSSNQHYRRNIEKHADRNRNNYTDTGGSGPAEFPITSKVFSDSWTRHHDGSPRCSHNGLPLHVEKTE
jgi:hypothetical protein